MKVEICGYEGPEKGRIWERRRQSNTKVNTGTNMPEASLLKSNPTGPPERPVLGIDWYCLTVPEGNVRVV